MTMYLHILFSARPRPGARCCFSTLEATRGKSESIAHRCYLGEEVFWAKKRRRDASQSSCQEHPLAKRTSAVLSTEGRVVGLCRAKLKPNGPAGYRWIGSEILKIRMLPVHRENTGSNEEMSLTRL